MCHFYSYQIHSVRLVNRKSKMAAICQNGHKQINFTSSSRTQLTEFVNFVVNINILKMLKSPLNVPYYPSVTIIHVIYHVNILQMANHARYNLPRVSLQLAPGVVTTCPGCRYNLPRVSLQLAPGVVTTCPGCRYNLPRVSLQLAPGVVTTCSVPG